MDWSALGGGTSGPVRALKVFDDGGGPALFVAGDFQVAGGVTANRIAKWTGNWSPLGAGTNSTVSALEVFDDGRGGGPALYAGGSFTSATGVPANRVAKWDGTTWSRLGTGTNADVRELRAFDDGSGPALYAGGDFTAAGGVSANRVAKWDGSTWSAVGTGFDRTVRSLTVFDDGSGAGPTLYAGGAFTKAPGGGTRIAKWDGGSWVSLASEMNGTVRTMATFDDGSGPALYAGGGFFSSASGDSYLAKWGCPSPTFTVFCTAKTTNICGPANISATGFPSATESSGFVIKAQPVRGCRAGLLLYSNQPTVAGTPFGGPGDGVLCLFGPGLRRAGPIQTGSMPQFCDATLAIDMNRFRSLNWTAVGCNPPPGQNNPAGFLGNMGVTVQAQMWGRDSIATGQILSDGLSWSVGP